VILLALLACSAPFEESHNDLDAYLDASHQSDFTKGLESCFRIQSTEQKGECVAFQVQNGARKHPQKATEACHKLEPGLWKDECQFLLAEGITVPEAPEAAAAACRDAGRYFQPCFMHLLNAHAGHLRSTHSPNKVIDAYASALALVGPKAPSDFRHRAWSLLFRSEAQDAPALDPGNCEQLPTHGPACRSGIREALSRSLTKAMREASPEAQQGACAVTPPKSEQLAPVLEQLFEIRIKAHPVLDAPLQQWHQQHCTR
jgi:hypothetical protein